jgi:hypothetical protein
VAFWPKVTFGLEKKTLRRAGDLLLDLLLATREIGAKNVLDSSP